MCGVIKEPGCNSAENSLDLLSLKIIFLGYASRYK